MTAITTRPATSADAGALALLLNAIIARGGTTALETPMTPEALDLAYLTGPDVLCCHVAEGPDGRLEGFQTLIRDPRLPGNWGDIGTFARVDGSQKGVGTALFAATVARARVLGLRGINATIRADNAGGLAFYDRMGLTDYARDRAVPLMNGTPVDRVRKQYVLTAAKEAA